jgi:tetratricopeptide (TPR) repeat protein
MGQHDRSIACLKEALKISPHIGNKHIEGRALMNLGKAHLETGQTEKAIAYHGHALHILRDIGYRREQGDTLCSIGWAYESLGDSRQAKECYEQSLDIMREIGDRRGEANSLLSLGGCLLRLGDLRPATGHLLNAREIAEEVGKHSAGHFANRYLAQAYLERGRLEDALDAIALTLRLDLPLYNSEAAVLHGIVLARMGQVDAAQAAFKRARRLATELLQRAPRYFRAGYAHGLALLGLALLSSGRAQNELIEEAWDAYEAARAICDDKGVLADALRRLDELRPLDNFGMLDTIAGELIEQPAHIE